LKSNQKYSFEPEIFLNQFSKETKFHISNIALFKELLPQDVELSTVFHK
jgi:hypothetical protein